MLKLPERGITLLEILVTIAIIASISVVVIPNLRKLNQSQDLENATADLVQHLRQAQANATAGVPCSADITTTGWWVKLDPVTNSYQLVASCHDLYTPPASPSPVPTPYDEVRSTLNLPGGVGITAINNNDGSCPSNNLEVSFSGSSVNFFCAGAALSSNPTTITLQDNRSLETKEIKIDKGGSIERSQ